MNKRCEIEEAPVHFSMASDYAFTFGFPKKANNTFCHK